MKAVLFRTGSGSVPAHTALLPFSPQIPVSLSVQDFSPGLHSGEAGGVSSTKISLNLEVQRRGIRRSSSESDAIGSAINSLSNVGSRSFPSRIPEEASADAFVLKGIGSLTLTQEAQGKWPLNGIPSEELGFPGGGINKNWNCGGSSGGNGDTGDWSKMGAYYEEMLKTDPNNSLLLRNYGKYLHEVERDVEKAEEYYGRAILASPGDGEVLSLYGLFIWETQRDANRAKSCLDQSLSASPNDCMVLGSYAHFMWEAEEEEEDEGEMQSNKGELSRAVMAHAF